jgi:hypothetical protein
MDFQLKRRTVSTALACAAVLAAIGLSPQVDRAAANHVPYIWAYGPTSTLCVPVFSDYQAPINAPYGIKIKAVARSQYNNAGSNCARYWGRPTGSIWAKQALYSRTNNGSIWYYCGQATTTNATYGGYQAGWEFADAPTWTNGVVNGDCKGPGTHPFRSQAFGAVHDGAAWRPPQGLNPYEHEFFARLL